MELWQTGSAPLRGLCDIELMWSPRAGHKAGSGSIVSAAISAWLTASHPNSEVKQVRAGVVLRWGTTREGPVLRFFFLIVFRYFRTLSAFPQISSAGCLPETCVSAHTRARGDLGDVRRPRPHLSAPQGQDGVVGASGDKGARPSPRRAPDHLPSATRAVRLRREHDAPLALRPHRRHRRLGDVL